jgi:hypothetical protein
MPGVRFEAYGPRTWFLNSGDARKTWFMVRFVMNSWRIRLPGTFGWPVAKTTFAPVRRKPAP